jgi:Na+-translocating ferredoxin:NAD+ oxidoreductase RnfA subunit
MLATNRWERQIAAIYAISITGIITPIQAIYQGGTDRSHPVAMSSNIQNTHSKSFWCTMETVLAFFETLYARYILPQAQSRVDVDPKKAPWSFIWAVHCTHIDQNTRATSARLYCMFGIFLPVTLTNCIHLTYFSMQLFNKKKKMCAKRMRSLAWECCFVIRTWPRERIQKIWISKSIENERTTTKVLLGNGMAEHDWQFNNEECLMNQLNA